MKVSKKSDYALRALISLAENPEVLHSIRELALKNDIPKRFLEHIMLDLKDAGIVKGIPGRIGGYSLALKPQDISMGRVIRLFDGMLSPIACVSQREYEHCSQEGKCKFRRLFLEIRNHVAKVMEQSTLYDLITLAPVEQKEVTSAFSWDYSI